MNNDFGKQVRKLLKENGCTFVKKGKVGYEIWFCPLTNKYFTVDGVVKSRRLANTILKHGKIEQEQV